MQSILTALFIAEVSYVVVGFDLLRRASRTRGLPEFFLGLAFVFNGLSYFFGDFPSIAGFDTFLNEFSVIGRLFAGLCALTIAGFTWRVFRVRAGWARCCFWAIGALLAVGITVSLLEGDFEGAYPLTYTGYWFEWLGGILAFVWLAIESLHAYSKARRQVRIGLADPIVSNRFLLIGLYGALATSTYPLYLWMYIGYELNGTWSDPMQVAAGIVEIFSLASLWISFSTPAFYRRWVGGTRTAS